MTTITTADCKKFIVDFQMKNPNLERIRFGLNPNDNVESNPDYQFIKDILVEKNWKRLFKMKPDPDEHSNVIYVSGQMFNRFAEPISQVSWNDIKYVRGFDMVTADGQIAYLVLEMKDGTLHLGEYIGD